MRILMTTDTIGGVWRFTQELIFGLLEEDCAIALVSFGMLPSGVHSSWIRQMKARWGDRFDYIGTDIPLEWMQNNQCSYQEAAPLLLDLVDDFKTDIFHANQFCFGALPISIPKVVTAHSDVLSWAASCRTEPLESCPWLEQYCTLFSTGLSGASAIVAPTRWLLDELSKCSVLPKEGYVIPNGRSLSPAASVCRKLQAVTAGRLWDEAKNVAMLAELSSPVPIIAVGDTVCGSSVVPVLTKVHLLEHMGAEELLALFRESAIYICTSKYEPFGLAPLEAALCGCAVLANDIPSLREVWGDGALYFTDADSLAGHLEELSSDASVLASRQLSSHQRALTYSRERMTAAYLGLFREVIVRTHEEEFIDVA